MVSSKNEFNLEKSTTALRELSHFLQRLNELDIPKSEEIKKAVQNSLKEICTGFLGHL